MSAITPGAARRSGIGRRAAERVRRTVRASPLLYRAYLRISGKGERAVFPGPGVDLHLTGFPRSANTYATRLVEHAAPGLRLSTHIHAVASLRLALRHRVPTLVLLRDPLSAVASGLVRAGAAPGDEPVTSRWLGDYMAYHAFIARHRDRIRLLPFETVTRDPGRLLDAIETLCPGHVRLEPGGADLARETVLGRMERTNRRRAASRSSIPNPEKAARKRGHEAAIRAHPLYPRSEALYVQLRGDAARGKPRERRGPAQGQAEE